MHPEILRKASTPVVSPNTVNVNMGQSANLPYVPFGRILSSLSEENIARRSSPTVKVNIVPSVATPSTPASSVPSVPSMPQNQYQPPHHRSIYEQVTSPVPANNSNAQMPMVRPVVPYQTGNMGTNISLVNHEFSPYENSTINIPFSESHTQERTNVGTSWTSPSLSVPTSYPKDTRSYGMKPVVIDEAPRSVYSIYSDVDPLSSFNENTEYDVTQHNRYLDMAGIPEEEYGTNFTSKDDIRSRGWAIQREMYGFDEREMWNLDNQFMQWLYSRCMFFLDHGLCADDVFIVLDGLTYSQEMALKEICSDAIFCIRNQYTQDAITEDEVVNRMCHATRMWAEVLPAMWTDQQ